MKVVRLVFMSILALSLLGVLPRPSHAEVAAPADFFVFKSDAGWWACDQPPCTYDAPQVSGRLVSGDFNADGLAEIAAWYDVGGPSEIDVWQSTTKSFSDRTPWMMCSFACGLNVLADGGLVAGDFDGDGKDDIAALYDYGNGAAELDVWLSTGALFLGGESGPWWYCHDAGCYSTARSARRVVAGDFNGDKRDDIAALYDTGNDTSTIRVWLSTGSGFTYQGSTGWWQCTAGGCYWASRVTGRMVAGDYNGDGRDDIATLYDFGSNETAMHVFLSTGSAFTYSGAGGWWSCMSVDCYPAWRVTRRMVAGDFDKDGRDDVAALYDYDGGSSRLHVWLGKGAAFEYQGNLGWWRRGPEYGASYWADTVTGRLVAGDVNGDGHADIIGLHDDGGQHARLHVWVAAWWVTTPRTFLPLIMKK